MGGGGREALDCGRALVTRGEVWWGEDPDSGRRPFLILTRETAIPALRKLVVVPATRTVRGIPTEVLVDESDGMPVRSALSADNVTTLPRAFLVERICRLEVDRMHQVCAALAIATGCS
jgi:mRNA interferase MazF